MKNIRDLIDGDLTIKNETTLNGLKIGNVIVNDNITFRVKGILTGDITIKQNGFLIIDGGLINGNIFNSGICLINGVINGLLFTLSGRSGFSRNGYLNAHQL